MLTISNYHYIREEFNQDFPSIFGLTPYEFKNQLNLIKQIGIFVSPKDFQENYFEILNSKTNYYMVTFDDGLKEQYELAKPILDSLNITALYFINSMNFIEKKISLVHKIHLVRSKISPYNLMETIENEKKIKMSNLEKQIAINHYNYDKIDNALLKYILNFKLSIKEQNKIINTIFLDFFNHNDIFDKLYMNEKQLKNLSENYSIGNHSHSHLPLGLYSKKIIKNEIEKSKIYLEKLTNNEIIYISYPYGSFEACTKSVFKESEKLGHKFGFTMERGVNTNDKNLLNMKRLDCNDVIGGKNYIKNK